MRFFRRSLSVLLAAAFCFPGPAYALRPSIENETPSKVAAGLEEFLFNRPVPMDRFKNPLEYKDKMEVSLALIIMDGEPILKELLRLLWEDVWRHEPGRRNFSGTLTYYHPMFGEISQTVGMQDFVYKGIVRHFLHNAADAVADRWLPSQIHSSGKLEVRSFIRDGDLWIQVLDNGRGFPPEILDRLGKEKVTTKRIGESAGGAGEGLLKAFGYAEKHGWRVVLENRTDETGAVASLVIPLAASGTEENVERRIEAITAGLGRSEQQAVPLGFPAYLLENFSGMDYWKERMGRLIDSLLKHPDPKSAREPVRALLAQMDSEVLARALAAEWPSQFHSRITPLWCDYAIALPRADDWLLLPILTFNDDERVAERYQKALAAYSSRAAGLAFGRNGPHQRISTTLRQFAVDEFDTRTAPDLLEGFSPHSSELLRRVEALRKEKESNAALEQEARDYCGLLWNGLMVPAGRGRLADYERDYFDPLAKRAADQGIRLDLLLGQSISLFPKFLPAENPPPFLLFQNQSFGKTEIERYLSSYNIRAKAWGGKPVSLWDITAGADHALPYFQENGRPYEETGRRLQHLLQIYAFLQRKGKEALAAAGAEERGRIYDSANRIAQAVSRQDKRDELVILSEAQARRDYLGGRKPTPPETLRRINDLLANHGIFITEKPRGPQGTSRLAHPASMAGLLFKNLARDPAISRDPGISGTVEIPYLQFKKRVPSPRMSREYLRAHPETLKELNRFLALGLQETAPDRETDPIGFLLWKTPSAAKLRDREILTVRLLFKHIDYDPVEVAKGLIRRAAQELYTRKELFRARYVRGDWIELPPDTIASLGDEFPSGTALRTGKTLKQRIEKALVDLFGNAAPAPNGSSPNLVYSDINALRKEGIRGIRIVPGSPPRNPDLEPHALARRILQAVSRSTDPPLPQGGVIRLTYTGVGKLLNNQRIADYLSHRAGSVKSLNILFEDLFARIPLSKPINPKEDPAGASVQALKRSGYTGIRIEKGIWRGTAAGTEETARAAEILRPLFGPADSQSDAEVVRSFLETLRRAPEGAVDISQPPASALLSAPYKAGSFARGEMDEAAAARYATKDWIPSLHKVLKGIAAQLEPLYPGVQPEDLGAERLSALLSHLFFARDEQGRLLMAPDEETHFYRWIYREFPRLLVPRLAAGRILRDEALTRAVENPFRITNTEGNAAVRRAIAELLADSSSGFSDDPGRLRRDPSLLKPWFFLAIAANLVDYSHESILREIEQEGDLARYILNRMNTPFPPEIDPEPHFKRFFARLSEHNAFLVHLPDNNAELAASLKVAETLLSAFPDLRLATIVKWDNGAMNDGSLADAEELLAVPPAGAPDIYKLLREYQAQGRFRLIRGPFQHGTPLDWLPAEAVAALQASPIVFSEGEANLGSLNGLAKEVYFGLRLKWPVLVTEIFGLDLPPGLAAQRPPVFFGLDGTRGRYYNNPYDAPASGMKRTILQTLAEQAAAGTEETSNQKIWNENRQKILSYLREYAREHPGGFVTIEGIAGGTLLGERTVRSHNYRALIGEVNQPLPEDAKLKTLRPGQNPADMQTEQKILNYLRGLSGGQVTTGTIAEGTGLGVSTVSDHDYRKLAERVNEEQQRSGNRRLTALNSGQHSDPKETDEKILDFLRGRRKGGFVSQREIAKGAGVATRTLRARNYRKFIAQVNTERGPEEEPLTTDRPRPAARQRKRAPAVKEPAEPPRAAPPEKPSRPARPRPDSAVELAEKMDRRLQQGETVPLKAVRALLRRYFREVFKTTGAIAFADFFAAATETAPNDPAAFWGLVYPVLKQAEELTPSEVGNFLDRRFHDLIDPSQAGGTSAAGTEETWLKRLDRAAAILEERGWIVSAKEFQAPFIKAASSLERGRQTAHRSYQFRRLERRTETLEGFSRLLELLAHPSPDNPLRVWKILRSAPLDLRVILEVPNHTRKMFAFLSVRSDQQAPLLTISFTPSGRKNERTGSLRIGVDYAPKSRNALIHADITEPSRSNPQTDSSWQHHRSLVRAWKNRHLQEPPLSVFHNSFIGNLDAQIRRLPPRWNEALERKDFSARYPDQRNRIPDAASHVLVLLPENPVTFYRPDSIAGFLNDWVRSQRDWFTSRIRINQEPLPASANGIELPALIVKDRWLELPYSSPVPVIEHTLGQRFPFRLPQMIAAAMLGTTDARAVKILSSWTFERDGHAYLAIAVSA